jgi:scyllo-inositol 2-dehydrogenase (NADP+)
MRVLVVSGHPEPGQATAAAISQQLSAGGMEVVQSTESSVIRRLDSKNFACVVLAPTCQVTENDVLSLEDHVRAGGGLVAVGAPGSTSGHFHLLAGLLGCRVLKHSRPMDIRIQVADHGHPLARRLRDFVIHDELSHIEKSLDSHAFLVAWHDGKPMPLAHTRREGDGRVVTLGLGRTETGIAQPEWQALLRRSVRYASGEDWSAKPLRAMIIGYGGSFNTGRLHAESLARMGVPTVAVCDRDPRRCAAAKNELGEQVHVGADPEEMLAATPSELCVICTPHETHARLASLVLKHQRHVVIEKPFALTLPDADRVLAEATSVNRIATAFHHRRWDGDYRAMKEAVVSGVIGEVFRVECFFGGYGEPRPDWWRTDQKISGGLVFDFGPHFVDWVLDLMGGQLAAVAGSHHKRLWHQVSNEDHLDCHLRFSDGRTAEVQVSTLAAAPRSRFRILGTRGALEQVTAEPSEGIRQTVVRDGRRYETVLPCHATDSDGFYRNLIDHLQLGEPLAVPPDVVRTVTAVLDLAGASARQSGDLIRVPGAAIGGAAS